MLITLINIVGYIGLAFIGTIAAFGILYCFLSWLDGRILKSNMLRDSISKYLN